MTTILHSAGFLGTNANFAADATLVVMLFAAALFTLGVALALRRRYEAHRWVQTSAAALNAIMVGWMMVLPFRDFVLRDQGGPRLPIFYAITAAHALMGFTALTFGLFVVLRGNGLMIAPLRFRRYKPFMRAAYGLYMTATLIGLLVYIVWFVVEPNPPLYR